MKTLYGEDLVTELRNNSDSIKKRLWISVPFIGGLESVRRIIGRTWIDNPNLSIRLLTDINEFNNFSSDTIKLFGKLGEIRHLPGLHAKIYVTDNSCLVTSANLTNTAFAKRHEIGIFLDSLEGSTAILVFESWWEKSQKVSLKKLTPLIIRTHESSDESQYFDLTTIWKLPVERKISYKNKSVYGSDYGNDFYYVNVGAT